MIAATAWGIVGSMLVRPPRDDDFAALAALTNHDIATTAVHLGYDAVAEGELRGQWQRDLPYKGGLEPVGHHHAR